MGSKKKLTTFDDLFNKVMNDESFVSPFVSGHLVLDFLLRKLIQVYDPKLRSLSNDLSFYQIVNLSSDLGTISEEQKVTLMEINKIRNKLVHEITYKPSITELRKVLILASKGFSDFTDGIEQGLDELKRAKLINDVMEGWVINELFLQVSYDLFHKYQDEGGKEIADF